MNITTKLHMILVLIIIAVAVYMFLLYKELRIFERDIHNLKAQVSSLVVSVESKAAGVSACPPIPSDVADTYSPKEDDSTNKIDDSDSVTSEEIKNIITNIQDIEDDADDADVGDVVEKEDQQIKKEHTPSHNDIESDTIIDDDDVKQSIIRGQIGGESNAEKDLTIMSDEELASLKHEELRTFLKAKLGVSSIKGSKHDFIAKIKSLKTV